MVSVLVVRRALEEHGEAALRRGPVDVSPQRHAVAHLHGHVGLEDNGIWLGGGSGGRGEQQIHQCDAGDDADSVHDAVLWFEKPGAAYQKNGGATCAWAVARRVRRDANVNGRREHRGRRPVGRITIEEWAPRAPVSHPPGVRLSTARDSAHVSDRLAGREREPLFVRPRIVGHVGVGRRVDVRECERGHFHLLEHPAKIPFDRRLIPCGVVGAVFARSQCHVLVCQLHSSTRRCSRAGAVARLRGAAGRVVGRPGDASVRVAASSQSEGSHPSGHARTSG